MAMRRARHAATASFTAATRGRLSERDWADVRRAAIIAREEGVAVRVRGIDASLRAVDGIVCQA